jgi:hypothetical protein
MDGTVATGTVGAVVAFAEQPTNKNKKRILEIKPAFTLKPSILSSESLLS